MGILKKMKKRAERDYMPDDVFDPVEEEYIDGEEAQDVESYDGEPYDEEEDSGEVYDEDGEYNGEEAYDDEPYDDDEFYDDGEFYDEKEPYDEEYDEQDEEDLFSLEEELRQERVRQWTMYLIFAVCALAVIALALYGSYVLTNGRLEKQQAIATVPQESAAPIGTLPTEETPDPDAPVTAVPTAAPLTYWPMAQYPGVPALESEAYETVLDNGLARVAVPSAAAKGFDAYVDTLCDEGAVLIVNTSRLSVLLLNNVEIHLINTNLESAVVLCDEPSLSWNDPAYSAFVLPADGTLVRVSEGLGADSRVLTYRRAFITDALNYVTKLMQAGWSIQGSLGPVNNQFAVSLRRNNLQITVDYFSTTEDYLVKLDYIG
jgi:hypothetical protein